MLSIYAAMFPSYVIGRKLRINIWQSNYKEGLFRICYPSIYTAMFSSYVIGRKIRINIGRSNYKEGLVQHFNPELVK